MVLVDTSVWVAVFRRKPVVRMEQVVEFEDVVTCLPVIQEVLQGFRDERAHRVAREAMLALPIIESPMTLEAYLGAAELYRAARRTGITPRSAADCLIAQCALRHGLALLHHDRDFEALARISPLQVLRLT